VKGLKSLPLGNIVVKITSHECKKIGQFVVLTLLFFMYKILYQQINIMPVIVFNRTLTNRVACAYVAVETTERKTWIAYQAIIPMTHIKNNSLIKAAAQAIPLNGSQVNETLARRIFPQLKDWKYIFPTVHKQCAKCKRHKREMYMKKAGLSRNKKQRWECFPYCHKGEGFPAKDVFEGFNMNVRRKKKREIVIPLRLGQNISYPSDITFTEVNNAIRKMTKITDLKLSKPDFFK
jgi:hypothetical protein